MKVQRRDYDDFGGGIDRRGGSLSNRADRFHSLTNYVTTPGRKLQMRPPLVAYAGELDIAHTQGAAYLNGRIVTIAKLGAVVSHTLATDTTTLYFDAPDGSDDWELLETVTYNETVCAVIRHAFPASPATPYRNFLHIFDGARATYCTDPACPTSWAPAYPTHPFGSGTRGSYRDYRPRLAVVGDRLAMTTPGGDVALCAVGLPRVWNTLSPSDILSNGEMFYDFLNAADTEQSFVVPIAHQDLVSARRYAAYVTEYIDESGVWHQFAEGVTAAGGCRIEAIENRFDSTTLGETRVHYAPKHGMAAGDLIRFRAIANPTVSVVQGLTLTAITLGASQLAVTGGDIVGGTIVHEGKSINVGTTPAPDISTPDTALLLCVPVPGAPVEAKTLATVSSDGISLNGQERYWHRIVASVVSNDAHIDRADLRRLYRSVSGRFFIIDGISPWYNSDRQGSIHGFADAPTNPAGTPITFGGMKFSLVGLVPSGTIIYERASWTHFYIQVEGGNVVEVLPQEPGCYTLSRHDSYGVYAAGSTRYPWSIDVFQGGYVYAIAGRTSITVGGTIINGVEGARYTADLKVGSTIEVNGERRVIKTITGDASAEVELPFTTAGTFIALRDPTYEYAADVGDTGNEWYAAKEAEVTLRGAGKDDAIVLGTSNYDPSGASPVAIAAMDDRMLVQYPTVLQSWAVGPRVTDFARLATMGQGAGDGNTRPQAVLADAYAGIPTANGPRLFTPSSDAKNYIDFVSVGDMLRGIPIPDLTRSVWWPQMRAWVSCAASGDAGRFYVLSMHKDEKVLAWSVWQVADVSTVDALFLVGNRLAVKSGANVRYFDPDATAFVDFSGAYIATARWLYNIVNASRANKKLISCDIVQTGKATLRAYVNPRNVADTPIDGPTVAGVTYGMQRIQIMAMGPGIALEIESSDPSGHTLDQISIDYTLLNR